MSHGHTSHLKTVNCPQAEEYLELHVCKRNRCTRAKWPIRPKLFPVSVA